MFPKKAKIEFPNALVFSGEAPTNFSALDLSAIVGKNSALVNLLINISSACASEVRFIFRQPGDGEIGDETSSAGKVVPPNQKGYVSVVTDATGHIEWKVTDPSCNTDIILKAFIAKK